MIGEDPYKNSVNGGVINYEIKQEE
ncbi:DNA gyrase inhibitor, partial [Escherichia coli]|nr:DNA gyrase inhibitor [Escherichia coli]